MSDAEEEDQSPLLNELTLDQLKDVAWRAGLGIGDALWHLHDESLWKPNTTLPTGSDEDALVKETRKHVLKVLEEKDLLRVRDLELDGDACAHEAITVDRMNYFFRALLRIGHIAAQLYYKWPNNTTVELALVLRPESWQPDPGVPPFAFPDVVEVSIELHFKSVLARAAEKALTNPGEPLCTIFEVPAKDGDDDDDEESIDEGSDIGDNSNSDEDESESEIEEEENEEEEPPTKKKK